LIPTMVMIYAARYGVMSPNHVSHVSRVVIIVMAAI